MLMNRTWSLSLADWSISRMITWLVWLVDYLVSVAGGALVGCPTIDIWVFVMIIYFSIQATEKYSKSNVLMKH